MDNDILDLNHLPASSGAATGDDDLGRAVKIRRTTSDLSRQISVDETTEDSKVHQHEGVDSESDTESDIDSDVEDEDLSDDGEEYFSDEDDRSASDDEGNDLDETTIDKIKHNDPTLTSLTICNSFPSIHAQEAGYYIGKSTTIKKLTLKGANYTWDGPSAVQDSHVHFSNGVSKNRSIEYLAIHECSLENYPTEADRTYIPTLPPFIEHNLKLHSLEIVGCDMGNVSASLLAGALSRRGNSDDTDSSLRRINLDANRIGDTVGSELITALVKHTQLEYLSLGDNEIGTLSMKALETMLSTSNKLQELNLENNCIDNEGIEILTRGLKNNTSLKELNLSFNCNITQVGWCIFSTCLKQQERQECIIEKLNLSSTNISNEGISAIGNALLHNTTLKELDLYDINTDGVPLITSPSSWNDLFSCIQYNPCSALEQIDLRYSSISSEGLLILADALTVTTTSSKSIKMIDLGFNNVSVSGWKSFFSRLGSNKFALEELFVQGNNITDEVMEDLCNALVQNETLKNIAIGNMFTITESGWEHVRRLLCNKLNGIDTISNTSNHTLCSLGYEGIPQDVQSLLSFNQAGHSKHEVVRAKILQHHFVHNETDTVTDGVNNIQEFLDMDLNVLPVALSWVGKDNIGRTHMYQLMRSLPSLLGTASEKKSVLKKATITGVKRKRH